ncbi:MAG: hypothetical protein QM736_20110 [Vicinamibacterales bacterium]
MSGQNESANTLTVRCRLTNALIGSAANIMMPTESTTAATNHTPTLSTMPTAVITESSEKTMSSSIICPMTAGTTAPLWRSRAFLSFEPLVNFDGRLPHQEQAAAEQNEVAPRDLADRQS